MENTVIKVAKNSNAEKKCRFKRNLLSAARKSGNVLNTSSNHWWFAKKWSAKFALEFAVMSKPTALKETIVLPNVSLWAPSCL